MSKVPPRYARPRRRGRRIVGYARTHRARTLALFGVTNASAEVTIPAGAIRAESFNEPQGARLEGTVDIGGGKNVGWLANGDWMRYNGVDLGPAGSLTTSVRVAAAVNDGGTVQVRVDSLIGQVIASIPSSTAPAARRTERSSARTATGRCAATGAP